MASRALRICDPPYLDAELEHIRNTFKKLCYPNHIINTCISKAKKRHFIPTAKKDMDNKHFVTLPYHHNLNQISRFINKNSKTHIAFTYENSIKSKITKNNSTKKEEEVGVYSIACKDCSSFYFGETGRDIKVRCQEHKRAVREYSQYSAIAKHCWDMDHKMNWDSIKLIYNDRNVGRRRVVEGALIDVGNSLPDNKSFTQEDKQTNKLICQSLKINVNNLNVPQNTAAASSLPVQVADATDIAEATGTDAVSSPTRVSQGQTIVPVRRSQRLALRSSTGIT